MQHVDKVLQLLKEQQLYAKPSKCFFGVKEVDYLGHFVSHEGVKVDPNKIKATMDWSIRKTLKNIRGFLGLIGYYHKSFEIHLIILLVERGRLLTLVIDVVTYQNTPLDI